MPICDAIQLHHELQVSGNTDTSVTLTSWSTVLLAKLTVRSASQEMTHPFQNQKVHYVSQNLTSPPVPLLSQINPVYTPKTHFHKIQFNIILPSTPRSSKWSLPFRISNLYFVRISHCIHGCYMYRPSDLHLIVPIISYE
jgi:hypothetical protein